MTTRGRYDEVFSSLIRKGALKQQVYRNTCQTFQEFKTIIREMAEDYARKTSRDKSIVPFEFTDKGEFQMELKFAGDVLLFVMHTNVFEFSRYHEVMKTPYVKEDTERSFCGVINIYNFLADSFKYNRINDLGYLIGRVFINKDMHYFIEGKREIGFLFNNFGNAVMNREAARQIIESSILYTINFDLLTPPFDAVKEVTVEEMRTALDSMLTRTGKRLGFRFQGDHEEFDSSKL
ncbi:MAG: hypothetical protein PHD61_04125 [Bacteroidales bacterium]|nr:hypothetical protein [Lentimicrobiaceae bacterium]MDD5694475.1 hypothetical protein [Bacteroidales bacterium]